MNEYQEITRELLWIVPSDAPKCPDDLSFTSRHETYGRINWWDPTPANTDYWEVHRQQGRAMAFELLDLINNPERERDEDGNTPNWFGCIAGEIARTESLMREKYNTDGLGLGFFEAIGEHLMTGRYNR